MNNYANHGYVVPATKLTVLLPNDKWTKFLDLVKENEPLPVILDELQEFYDSNSTYTPPVEFFVLNDEAESDGLEIGKVYAMFDEADLFEMTPSKFMDALNKEGIHPKNEQWVTWG